MAIKNGKINPLNALRMRKVGFPAHHFHYTSVGRYSPKQMNSINEWIFHNLNGRYYIGQTVDLVNNSITYVTRIGFEQEKELSFFSLACPELS